jgi:hypothetical protein
MPPQRQHQCAIKKENDFQMKYMSKAGILATLILATAWADQVTF